MWILLDVQGNLRSSGNGEEPTDFPSGWQLRQIGNVNLGDVYWDVPTQTFVPNGNANRTAVQQSYQTKDRNLISQGTIANALADLATLEANGVANLAGANTALKRMAQIDQAVIKALVRIIRSNYPDLIVDSNDV